MDTGPEQLRRSIDSLQRLYTIVVGLAVTEALRNFLAPQTVPDPWFANWRPLLILLITIIPFYHGANAHLDQTYLYGFAGKRREKRYALLIDFLVLFAEGILFFSLAVSMNNLDQFLRWFQTLLLLDVAWAIFVYISGPSSDDATHAWRWGVLNLGAFVVVSLIHDSPMLVPSARPDWLVGIAVLRTLVDYGICWPFYTAQTPMMASATSGR